MYHKWVTKEALAKTAFVTDKGKWQFHSLPFRINLGPSAFSYVLGTTLKHCQAFALNYLDDIIIFLKNWKEHLEHPQEVFKALQEADLKLKRVSVSSSSQKVHYLGYIVGADGVEPLPEKLEASQKLAAPHNVDELKQFLGLTGFYRKFVPFYADITQCLAKLLRKGIRYKWSDQCESAFNTLIEELCKAPTLQYPDPNRPFELFTDASHYCYSGILHEARIGESRPINTNCIFFRLLQCCTAKL